ncbi:MAG: Asp23/Gls24 family envelope stress response protein [Peptostreptococcaceae bacterium]|nr:Asp23/Gls24 family envelope stress response protein [Peptostreptococcaceae bacterium]
MNENITISEEVVVTIANIAAKEVKGVASLHSGMVDTILDKVRGNWSGGVSAVVSDDNILVSVILNVVYGEKIYEVAKNVQENIKSAIESMTEKKVSEVNVHVHGVVIVPEKTEK